MTKYERISEYQLNTQPYNHRRKYVGYYYGRVVDVNDPWGASQLKVHIPELMRGLKSDQGIWAIRMFTSEGNQSTIWYNRWVLIIFRNGNPNQPIVLGFVKHRDEGVPEVNPKTVAIENKIQKHFSEYFDRDFYNVVYQKNRMSNKKEQTLGARTHTIFRSPRLGHKFRVLDDDKYSYCEIVTQKRNSLTISDYKEYALLHVFSSSENEGNKLLLDHHNRYSELSTDKYWGAHFNSQEQYTILRSKTQWLMLDDKTQTVSIGESSSIKTSCENIDNILWDNPTERWAPETRIVSKMVADQNRNRLFNNNKLQNSSHYDGESGLQVHRNFESSIVMTKDGYIFLNCD